MEHTNESNKDSISIERNSKGFNYTAKCYQGGAGSPDETEEDIRKRLHRYVTFLEQTFGEKRDIPYYEVKE